MNEDKNLEALGAMIDIMDSSTRRNVEAYELCREVFNRLQAKSKEKPTGRRALVEHTKRKENE